MIVSVDQLMHRLGSALGAGGVSAGADLRAAHSVDGMKPQLVVSPASPEEVGAVLRLCSEARASVVPWGGGTAMAFGNLPRRADVVVRLEKLDRVVEHDAANLTVTAQSGVTLQALQSTLVAHKQFLPIDAPFPDRATLGGIVAANLNGPRRGHYGSVRDLVIGLKAMLGNGEMIKAGGKVVKNVAGYDMCKLFVGSFGTLGIITEVTVKVAPLPESAASIIGRGTLAQAERFVGDLFLSRLLPAAVFLLNDGPREDWRLAVACEGFAETVEGHLRDLRALAGRAGIVVEVLGDSQQRAIWERLRDFPLQGNRLVYRITVPRAAAFDFARQATDGSYSEMIADIAAGTIWLDFPASRTALARFSDLAAMAGERRGHTVVFSAPGSLKKSINVWGPTPPTLPLMREIKAQFDPQEVLNPGRFVGGL
jgi:glycolate oxidase FAD binding subunit